MDKVAKRNADIKDISGICRKLGCEVYGDNKFIGFQTYSKCGQDFNVEIYMELDCEPFKWNLRKELIDYYDAFDVDAETYIWLDNEGHGTNGAPYRMMDVWNDMNECRERIWELAMCFSAEVK